MPLSNFIPAPVQATSCHLHGPRGTHNSAKWLKIKNAGELFLLLVYPWRQIVGCVCFMALLIKHTDILSRPSWSCFPKYTGGGKGEPFGFQDSVMLFLHLNELTNVAIVKLIFISPCCEASCMFRGGGGGGSLHWFKAPAALCSSSF